MVDLQVAAVYQHVDAELVGGVGGVDQEGDEVAGGVVVAGFAQVVDDAGAFGGHVVLVVRLAGAYEGVGTPYVQQAVDAAVLGAVDHLVDGVAL